MINRERQSEGTTSTARMAQQSDRAPKSDAIAPSPEMWQASSVRVPPVLGSPVGISRIQQLKGNRAVSQMLAVQQSAETHGAVPKPNPAGLPDNLKAGIENLSGMSMDGVRVHYNSSQPAQLNALAYTQGTDVHIAPGQEKHLPHEAWHVVQQAQGRVQPTMQMKDGVPVNDDAGLEHEADVMGAKALAPAAQLVGGPEDEPLQGKSAPVQRTAPEQGGAMEQASIRAVLSRPRVVAQARRLDGLFGAEQLRRYHANVSYRPAASDVVQRVRGGIEFTEDGPTQLYAYPAPVGNVPRYNTFTIGAAAMSGFRVAGGTPANADLGNATNEDFDVLASTGNVKLTNDVMSAEWIIQRHMADVPAATLISNLRADVDNMFTARNALKNAVKGVKNGHPGEVAIVPGVVANINAAQTAFIYTPGPNKGKAQITAQYTNQDTIRRINKLNVSKYLTGTKVAEGEDTARISGTPSQALLQADIAGTTSFSRAEVLLSGLRGTSRAIPLTAGGGNRLTQQQVGLVKLMVLNDALANTMVRYDAEVGQGQDKNIQRFFPKSRRNEYVQAVAQAALDATEMGLLRAEIQRTQVADAQLLFNAADPGALRVDETFNALGQNHPNMAGMFEARHQLANTGAANPADLLNIKTEVLGANGALLAGWIGEVAMAYTDLTPAATEHQRGAGTDRVIKTSRGYTPVAGGGGAIYEMREREIAVDESGWFNIGSRDELNDAITRIFNAAG